MFLIFKESHSQRPAVSYVSDFIHCLLKFFFSLLTCCAAPGLAAAVSLTGWELEPLADPAKSSPHVTVFKNARIFGWKFDTLSAPSHVLARGNKIDFDSRLGFHRGGEFA